MSSFKKIFVLCLAVMFFVPGISFAHQPRILTGRDTVVPDPEISKAYYGQLQGEPQTYHITSDAPFVLYVNILVPDISGQKKDVSAEILKNGIPIATLDGTQFPWTRFWEDYGRDWYWKGPEYKATVSEGAYDIRVWSSRYDSKYSLAIGETEFFDFKEGVNALVLVPQLKKNFFNENPAGFLFSPFGYGYVLVMFFAAFVFGFLYRAVLRKIAKGTPRGLGQNIGTKDRVLRFALAAAFFAWAITTTWNPILLFLSGFCLFESFFSWCGLYAALGKNTCPIE